ncbi:MAG: GAF domain-containing protein [Anaerolineales bacterium]|nr:GAF domain-containing protein [Anaerolineales bacterium]
MNRALKSSLNKKFRRIELLEILNAVVLVAFQSPDYLDALETMLDIMVKEIGMDAGAIFLFEEETGKYQLCARRGISMDHVQEIERRREESPHHDHAMIAAETGKVVFVPDMAAEPRFEGMWEVRRDRSYVNIPLIARTNLQGTMGLVTPAGKPLTEIEVEILGMMGRHIGLLVENARLVEKIRRSEKEALILFQLGSNLSANLDLKHCLEVVAEDARKLLEADTGLVLMLNDDSRTVKVTAVAGKLAQTLLGLELWVQETLLDNTSSVQPSILAEVDRASRPMPFDVNMLLAKGFSSLLAQPINQGKKLIGFVGVLNKEGPGFSQEDAGLLSRLNQQVAIAVENAKLYSQVRSSAVLEERKILSREMHDDLSQVLGLLNMQAAIASENLCSCEINTSKATLEDLQTTAKRAYEQVRKSIFNLRALDSLEMDFIKSLRSYLDDYKLCYGIDARLFIGDESAMKFSSDVQVQLTRIIVEALVNIRKHSGTNQMEIHIDREGDWGHITIADAGRGFDPIQVIGIDSSRMGLQIMSERAKSVNGEVEIDSQPGSGTRIMVRLPMHSGVGEPK